MLSFNLKILPYLRLYCLYEVLVKLTDAEKLRRNIEERYQRQEVTRSFRVVGASMLPKFLPSTEVNLTYRNPRKLRRGDIIVFRIGDMRVMHRLIYIWGPLALEKGDANCHCGLIWIRSILGYISVIIAALGETIAQVG